MPSLLRKLSGPRATRRIWPAVKGAVRTREFWSLAALSALLLVLWDTPLLLPLKWLTVLFHELSHALTGWATGGRLVSLNITEQQGGICRIAGGNRTLILLAGYPGSLAWGLAALALAKRNRGRRPTLLALGCALLALTLLYVRPLAGFGFLFCLAAAFGLVLLAQKASPLMQQLAVRVIGVSSCIYVLVDIQQDVFFGYGGISDATLLARHTGIPGLFWGLLWYLIAGALLFRFFVSTSRPQ